MLLSPEVMFADDCYANIKKNYLGIFVHLGKGRFTLMRCSEYVYTEWLFQQYCYIFSGSAYEGESVTIVNNYDSHRLVEEYESGNNRLTIHGLNAFKLDDNQKSILKNLLHAWNDPGRLCDTDIEKNCLYQLLPYVYSKRR